MRALFATAVVVALLCWAATCALIVDQSEYAVVKRFGRPVAVCLEPGLRFKLPWPIDDVVRFDNRLMALETPAANQPDREYLTQDDQAGIGKNVVVSTFTAWRIRRDAAAVRTFLETMGDRTRAEARLGDVVVSELGAALGQNDFAVLVSVEEGKQRCEEFLAGVRERCRKRVQDAYGIEIVDIRIVRLNFPEQNRRNVFDRMRAERETIAARYRSEGEERATTIRAQANRQRDEILAQAEMEAEQTRGRADAEAARIYAEAYGQDPEFYRFLRTLESYEKTFDENTVAILSAGSEFLSLLTRGAEPAGQPTNPHTETDDARPGVATRPASPQ